MHILIRTCMVFLVTATASACSIPVFAYALNNWQPENHELHLNDAGRSAFAAFADSSANVEAIASEPSVAAVVLKRPDDAREWWSSGPEELTTALTSPARERMAKALLSGESLVWIMVRSGTARDAPVEDLLRKRLNQLQHTLELPAEERESRERPGPPLRIAFTVITIDQSDPVERGFVAQIQAELNKPLQGPMLAPVFGQGRLLEVLAGDELTERRIDELCTYVCGACSCIIKDLNPGVDLLTSTNWEMALMESRIPGQPQAVAMLENAEENQLPSVPSIPSAPVSSAPTPAPEVVRISADIPALAAVAPTATDEQAPPWRRWALIAIATVILVAGTLLILRRGHTNG